MRLAKFYITSVNSRITFNRVARFLNIPVKTAYNLSKYLEKAYLVFFVERFSFSSKSQDNSPKKVYSIDNSFPSILGLNRVEILGRLLENLIASTLYRISRQTADFRFYYWNENGKEVDFVLKHKMKYEAFQVAYSVRDDKTRAKEISDLLECAAVLNLAGCLVITMDYAYEEVVNGIKITYLPASEWIESTLDSYGVETAQAGPLTDGIQDSTDQPYSRINPQPSLKGSRFELRGDKTEFEHGTEIINIGGLANPFRFKLRNILARPLITQLMILDS